MIHMLIGVIKYKLNFSRLGRIDVDLFNYDRGREASLVIKGINGVDYELRNVMPELCLILPYI